MTVRTFGRCGLPDWPERRDNHRGAFAYVEAELADGEEVQLMRLRCGGTTSKWSFAPYCDRNNRYEDLPNGILAGAPEALDCACQLHLAAHGI
ncbi:hypothetical protein [Streptomyces sp. NPDC058086]|uniref:hypothetical protein n=1 Tax=Streptomyces sp. NPDC058086 TaxID=3346334 RepID=UPI0036E3CB28